jgi:hypothetical protein
VNKLVVVGGNNDMINSLVWVGFEMARRRAGRFRLMRYQLRERGAE